MQDVTLKSRWRCVSTYLCLLCLCIFFTITLQSIFNKFRKNQYYHTARLESLKQVAKTGFSNQRISRLNLNDRNITKIECPRTLSKYSINPNPAPVEVSRWFASLSQGLEWKPAGLSLLIYLNGILNYVSKTPANAHLDSPVSVKIMFIIFRSYQVCEWNCTK